MIEARLAHYPWIGGNANAFTGNAVEIGVERSVSVLVMDDGGSVASLLQPLVGLLVMSLRSTGEKELAGSLIAAAAVVGSLLLVVVIPMWINKQETVVVTETSIRSAVFGFIRFKEIASYEVNPFAYPPRIKLKLRDGRTIRFALRSTELWYLLHGARSPMEVQH